MDSVLDREHRPRLLIVVAKDRRDLFQYLRAAFRGLDDVKVIVDRRRIDAPGAGALVERELQALALSLDVPAAIEPRGEADRRGNTGPGGDRERRRDIYDELRERGFVAVRLW
jgi:hypothetical protein